MTEPLVLLPGMMCDARVFMPQITDLPRDHAVTVAPVSGAERVEELASTLLSLLPPKFALMNTTPLAETPAYAATREPRIVAARSGRLAQVMHEELPPSALAPHSDRKAIMGLVEDMADHMGVEVFVRQTRALQRRRDQQATLRQIRQPALVLTGAYDTITPVKRHEFMAELIPYAVLRVIEDAGHVPSLETPEELNAVLRDWLRMPLVLR